MDRFCDVVKLISFEKKKNENAFNVEIPHETEIFANIQSVKRSEFYEALRSGTTLQYCIIVNKGDYDLATYIDEKGKKNKPEKVEVEGDIYKIVRTYQKEEDLLEVMCEGE